MPNSHSNALVGGLGAEILDSNQMIASFADSQVMMYLIVTITSQQDGLTQDHKAFRHTPLIYYNPSRPSLALPP
jgi:hypothetical protein